MLMQTTGGHKALAPRSKQGKELVSILVYSDGFGKIDEYIKAAQLVGIAGFQLYLRKTDDGKGHGGFGEGGSISVHRSFFGLKGYKVILGAYMV